MSIRTRVWDRLQNTFTGQIRSHNWFLGRAEKVLGSSENISRIIFAWAFRRNVVYCTVVIGFIPMIFLYYPMLVKNVHCVCLLTLPHFELVTATRFPQNQRGEDSNVSKHLKTSKSIQNSRRWSNLKTTSEFREMFLKWLNIYWFGGLANVGNYISLLQTPEWVAPARFRKNRREEILNFSEHLKTLKSVKNSRRYSILNTLSKSSIFRSWAL